MPEPPSTRSLLNQAAHLAKRADQLAERAEHPFTRDQITLVGLAARDASHWVVESAGAADHLAAVAASLLTLASRLTELEELLDAHGADAVPPGHA